METCRDVLIITITDLYIWSDHVATKTSRQGWFLSYLLIDTKDLTDIGSMLPIIYKSKISINMHVSEAIYIREQPYTANKMEKILVWKLTWGFSLHDLIEFKTRPSQNLWVARAVQLDDLRVQCSWTIDDVHLSCTSSLQWPCLVVLEI